MRIVIATPFYPPQAGVLGTYAAGLESAFRKQGHDVTVVVFTSMLPPGMRHVMYFVRMILALRSASFVLALDTWSVGLPASLAARLRSVPFAVRIGGDFLWESYVERVREPILLSEFYTAPRTFSLKERIIHRGMRMLVRRADALLFTTKFQCELWKRAYTFREECAHIVENYFPPREERRELPSNHVFVHAGRDIFLKNTSLVHRVFERVQAKYPDVTVDERPLPHTEHRERVRRSYAVLVASVSEVCSNTAIDAVALGVPFICTKDTGTSERLGECGLFVDTRSEAEVEQAVEALLEPDAYERLAFRARSFSFVHSWDDIATEVVAIMST
ncbi:MAG: glycosyltransferase family 4 protein [Patescibacteria group bacterium]